MFRFTIPTFIVLIVCMDLVGLNSPQSADAQGVRRSRQSHVAHRWGRKCRNSARSLSRHTCRGKQDHCNDQSSHSKSPELDSKGVPTEPNRTVSLFDGKTLGEWEISSFGGEGEVVIEEGAILMEFGSNLTGIRYTGELPTNHYEISLEAMQVDGIDFFCGLTFPVNDSFCSFIVAGWGGAVVGLSNIDERDASDNDTTSFMKFEQGRWYKIRVRVVPGHIRCWIDEKQVVDIETKGKTISIRPEVEPSKPLGISAWETRSSLRNIRLTYLKED